MTIGIDLDGVLGTVIGPGQVAPWTATPIYKALIEGMRKAGHRVLCITPCCGPRDNPERFRAVRKQHLATLGISFRPDDLILVCDGAKGEACLLLKVDLYIDNDPAALAGVMHESPRTLALLCVGTGCER
jgi:hypothetical protein